MQKNNLNGVQPPLQNNIKLLNRDRKLASALKRNMARRKGVRADVQDTRLDSIVQLHAHNPLPPTQVAGLNAPNPALPGREEMALCLEKAAINSTREPAYAPPAHAAPATGISTPLPLQGAR